jgi:GT2 family glycosyltransferase
VKLAIVTAHADSPTVQEAISSWGHGWDTRVIVERGDDGMLRAYERGWRWDLIKDHEIIAFIHDDLILQEHYDQAWKRVIEVFEEDPTVGLVGFGGSTTHGTDGLYKDPYQIMQLSRGQFLSNMVDAEVHGKRYIGPPIEVAALDGYALIFRRELLEKTGGWPVNDLVFHGYDFWATCMAHRLGYKVKLVPIAIKHYGGMTSVGQHKDDGNNHAKGHEWIYNEFRDCLPWRCA